MARAMSTYSRIIIDIKTNNTMEIEVKKQTYESPQTEVVLIALEACIAMSDMTNNTIYEESFV